MTEVMITDVNSIINYKFFSQEIPIIQSGFLIDKKPLS